LREQRDWIGTAKEQLNRYIANDCDQIIAGLYENYVCYKPYFKEKAHFVPLPIRMSASSFNHQPSSLFPLPSSITIFIGISKGRSAYKGTDIMLRAAEDVLRTHPDKMKLIKAEGIPFNEYQKLMDGSDAILDQLYSYTPSMNPLLAMSKGIICIGGGEPENYEILGENELRPIINVQPTYESVRDELEQFVLHPERIPELKRQSIEYVCRHHDYIKVAKQYERIYSE
jgi:glycosyltransferase involved in cell wall biosynthesis